MKLDAINLFCAICERDRREFKANFITIKFAVAQ